MALGATVYNLEIDLADSDRGVYESLALRVARHPSESDECLIARVCVLRRVHREDYRNSRGLSRLTDLPFSDPAAHHRADERPHHAPIMTPADSVSSAKASFVNAKASVGVRRRATVVTTNLAFAEWVTVFAGDEKLTTALLDRLAHHATVLTTKGQSYRMRKRRSRDEP